MKKIVSLYMSVLVLALFTISANASLIVQPIPTDKPTELSIKWDWVEAGNESDAPILSHWASPINVSLNAGTWTISTSYAGGGAGARHLTNPHPGDQNAPLTLLSLSFADTNFGVHNVSKIVDHPSAGHVDAWTLAVEHNANHKNVITLAGNHVPTPATLALFGLGLGGLGWSRRKKA